MPPSHTPIYDISDLALELGLSAHKQLLYYAYRRSLESSYRTFPLAKRRGGTREINAPNRQLAYIQRQIQAFIHKRTSHLPSSFVYSFKVNCSAKHGAARHVAKEVVIKFDLTDFFGTINFGRVRGMFSSFPFHLPHNLASILAQLCCLNNKLPQGAPTSPIISNTICRKLDKQLSTFARQHGFTYTRYADDITFSSRSLKRIKAIVMHDDAAFTYKASSEISKIIEDNGFTLNESKTRVVFPTNKQMITGIVCNEKINVDRSYVRKIRTLLHIWRCNGEAAALDAYNRWKLYGSAGNLQLAIRGMILYVRYLKGDADAVFLRLAYKYNQQCGTEYRISANFNALATPDFKRAVWVTEATHTLYGSPISASMSEEDANNALMFKCGTGFFIQNLGFVTSFHNLKEKFRVYSSYNMHLDFNLSHLIAFDERLDFAVFDSSAVFGNSSLQASTGPIQAGDNIRFLGFPDYQTGDSLFDGNATVTQRRIVFGQELYSISGAIRKGHSGGPIVNQAGEVIGLMRSNYNGNNLFVPISTVVAEFSRVRDAGTPPTSLSTLSSLFTPFE